MIKTLYSIYPDTKSFISELFNKDEHLIYDILEVRPAPSQFSKEELLLTKLDKNSANMGHMYNKWYHKIQGGRDPLASDVLKSPVSRLDVVSHTGATLANQISIKQREKFPSIKSLKETYFKFCLNFSKGTCVAGHSCRYLHRIPIKEDIQFFKEHNLDKIDAFGRNKFVSFKKDKTGVGKIGENNKLQITRINIHKYKDEEEITNAIENEFKMFGPIKTIEVDVKNELFIIEYLESLNAEFAKEAMAMQPLKYEEILVIKWY